MSYSEQQFQEELEFTISEVKHNLDNRKNGLSGDGTIKELELILQELQDIKQKAISNSLPQKGQRQTGFSRIVLDTWDFSSTLGKKLSSLADKYKRKLN